MRTPQEVAREMVARGRSPEQVRAVAIAREDRELKAVAEQMLAERDVRKVA